MIKAKDLWKFLCNDMGVRFFSGVPSSHVNKLYKTMDSNIMFYIPAANERIALGLVNGARLSGAQSGLLLDSASVRRLAFDIQDFNSLFDLPLLVVTDPCTDLSVCNLPIHYIDNTNYMEAPNTGVLVAKEGFK
ncbi:MAG: hypothetical protein DRP42_01480 [Tenericutes bacterium]|nr:MAG: hypothetical protein DRP42_01480 [Mycoplasmatota bacterium]